MSKPFASRAGVCALCIFTLSAILAIASFVLFPRQHRATGTASAATLQPDQPATLAAHNRIHANYAAIPLAFEKNQGQTDPQVQYLARGEGYMLFLTPGDAVFSLRSRPAAVKSAVSERQFQQRAHVRHNSQTDSSAVVRMQLTGANLPARMTAGNPLPGVSNYFVGNDPSQWRTAVPHYARVSYQSVYPGVDLAFHGAQRQTEFDFVAAPGSNPAAIGFRFTGTKQIKTDDSGNLVISTVAGEVVLHKPVAYQENQGVRHQVDAQFVLQAGNCVRFRLGDFDRSRELVIDPSVTVEYSTYLGGSGDDEGYGIGFDSSGNAYVTGETASANFPGASGTNRLNGTANAFVTKFSANGSSLVYSTYVGGTGSDSGNAIVVNQTSGNVYVAGGTSSTNFPTTAGVFQSTCNSCTSSTATNAFIFQLNSSGSLAYSTYLGGTGSDAALGIALDGLGNVYIAGKTTSDDFPTQNPLQGFLSGSTSSGFVTKLNSTATAPLLYSTYLGGSSDGDSAGAIALDSSNNAYVTGQTFSPTFFTTTGAYQTTCGSCSNGNSNAFVTVINPTGSAFVYSTFLGGNSKDEGDGIYVDASGNAYVTGTTESSNFPVSSNALQTIYAGDTDAFVTKLNPIASPASLIYSTFLGGSGFDAGASIAVDGNGNAYITGQTASTNFPTANPTQSSPGGGNDAFVSEINSSGSALVFSTYLGGSEDEDDGGDYGAIAVDSAGANIYVTGNSASSNFPTVLPEQSSNAGGTDAFVVKYSQPTTASFTIGATTPAGVSPGSSATSTVTLTASNGYNSAVNLTCSVSGSGSPLPACSASSFSTNPVTPTSAGAQSTLTITTTGPSGAISRPSRVFYAMLLPFGLCLAGLGVRPTRLRNKWLGLLLMLAIVSALLLMPACGGSSSSGGGTGSGGTPAGSYTVTITGTGTDVNTTTQSTQVTLTVN